MRAVISEISSGARYTDGEMRVLLKFEDADSVYRELRFPVSKLGIADPRLDQEVEVMIVAAEVGR